MSRVVLHIGPPKTGTTAVQASLDSSRKQLLEQGVSYLPETTQASLAAMSLTQRSDPSTGIRVPDEEWRSLAARVLKSRTRITIVSSEWLAAASEDHIARVRQMFISRDVQIILTIRSLSAILPSRWRQNVLEGATYGYEEWLHMVFNDRSSSQSQRFWHQHRHDHLAQRWSRAFGMNNVHVVVVRENQPAFALEAIEEVLSVPKGTLKRDAAGANVSASDVVVEAVRLFNQRREQYGISRALGYTAVSRGALMQLHRQQVGRSIADQLPTTYLDGLERESRQIASGLRILGFPVYGDLDDLMEVKTVRTRPAEAMSEDSVAELIADVMIGQLRSLGLAVLNDNSSGSNPNGRPDGVDNVMLRGRRRRIAMLTHALLAARLSVLEILWLGCNLGIQFTARLIRGILKIVNRPKKLHNSRRQHDRLD